MGETKIHQGVCKNETEEGKGGCGVKMAVYIAGPSHTKKEQTQQVTDGHPKSNRSSLFPTLPPPNLNTLKLEDTKSIVANTGTEPQETLTTILLKKKSRSTL